jgi:cytochrome c553
VGANPAWPNVAGQKAVYLANTLKAFRAGLRKDPMMAGVVRGLSDANIADLAAYYAAQSCGPATKDGRTP